MDLINDIGKLRNSELSKTIDKRLKEFESFKNKNTKEWFSELCFCILTANSKAVTGLKIQDELKAKGFCEYSHDLIRETIRKNKHRFHNNKANYIVSARVHINIKDKIKKITKQKGEHEAREWLVKNVKGLGYKEASHFLRNVGYKSLAILDRHILSLMEESGFIKEKPKTLNKKNYFEIEEIFKKIAEILKMSCAELDLYMWYMKTGEVLK
ncbi:N-glycosylase [Candidatus Woesearchaeota archaeon CG_4_10_14_0_2_um_filter_33_10]|nr:MAG: N-glycosylase [Candidatus Woesearchaeota archaeon CG1_02_33_12]PIN77497.1 MAG: N-glycosylase [Candidatus Woesearchaeota archaeon CG10_big_fil_rev_8_21_14_0_10_33_12]PIZ53475.1 MAG: N-glycosylase [Candidatus Woesearchaeota archaeon CG_4_10_14_0_2_um_filter_33_10]